MFIPILFQEIMKGSLCILSMLLFSSIREGIIPIINDRNYRRKCLYESIKTVLLPALLYSIQNWLSNLSSKYLDILSWHIINH